MADASHDVLELRRSRESRESRDSRDSRLSVDDPARPLLRVQADRAPRVGAAMQLARNVCALVALILAGMACGIIARTWFAVHGAPQTPSPQASSLQPPSQQASSLQPPSPQPSSRQPPPRSQPPSPATLPLQARPATAPPPMMVGRAPPPSAHVGLDGSTAAAAARTAPPAPGVPSRAEHELSPGRPCEAPLDVAILILSRPTANGATSRAAVRSAWAHWPDACAVRHWFVLGSASRERVEGDVLHVTASEGYGNVTLKVMHSVRWLLLSAPAQLLSPRAQRELAAQQSARQRVLSTLAPAAAPAREGRAGRAFAFRYLLKTDDDTYVCIGGLLRFLRSHRPLYAGKALSKRNPNPEVKLQPWHKWYDPAYVSVFGRRWYADYYQGVGYLLAAGLAQVCVSAQRGLRSRTVAIERRSHAQMKHVGARPIWLAGRASGCLRLNWAPVCVHPAVHAHPVCTRLCMHIRYVPGGHAPGVYTRWACTRGVYPVVHVHPRCARVLPICMHPVCPLLCDTIAIPCPHVGVDGRIAILA